MNADQTIVELQKTGAYMMDFGLAWGNAGNISARLDADLYAITASGTYLGELDKTDFAICSLNELPSHLKGVNRSSEKKPSKETPMHQAIYETRPEIKAVIHASPFYSTLVACSDIELSSDLFVETMYYLEQIERVPYQHPGSLALGEAVREKGGQANILLLENHGVLVYDVSLREARMALHTLEMACKMLIHARQAQVNLRGLAPEVVRDFLDNAGYKPKRSWGE